MLLIIINGFGIEWPKKKVTTVARTTQANNIHSNFSGMNNTRMEPAAIVPPTKPPINASEIVDSSIN